MFLLVLGDFIHSSTAEERHLGASAWHRTSQRKRSRHRYAVHHAHVTQRRVILGEEIVVETRWVNDLEATRTTNYTALL